MNESKKSSIIYINKWIVMVAIIVTASIGFFFGFIVGENYKRNQNTFIPTTSLYTSSKDTSKQIDVQKLESTFEKKLEEVKFENSNGVTPEKQAKDYYQEEQNKTIKKSNDYKKYTIQVGAFQNEIEAIALKTKLKKKGYNAFISLNKANNNGKLYKVKVGEFINREEAENFCNKLKRNEGIKAFVTIK